MTLDQKLSALADPASGFVGKIGLAENAIAGLSFANTWVTSPPVVTGTALSQLAPMPVTGTGRGRIEALRVLMMEAVERNSSVYIGSEDLAEGSVGLTSVVPVDRISLLSKAQRLKGYIRRLDPGKSIRLAYGRSILTGETRLIPAACVYLGYRAVDEPEYATAESNGCAAGVTREDATRRALLEVIERDALAIWWFNRLSRPALLIDADPLLTAIAEELRLEGRTLTLLDITHDLGTSVVAAYTADLGGRRIYIGCAADTSERRAAHRAACEMLQFWFWARVSVDIPERIEWLQNETLESQPWLRAGEARSIREQTDDFIGDSVLYLAKQLAKCGIEPIVVDLTKPWFQIPVVKVIAPGLRSPSPGFASGRLFDVPVKLGWREKPLAEEDLTQYPCPI